MKRTLLHDRTGQGRTGQDRTGQDRTYKYRKGKKSIGQDSGNNSVSPAQQYSTG
jgi:hypothetical protein